MSDAPEQPEASGQPEQQPPERAEAPERHEHSLEGVPAELAVRLDRYEGPLDLLLELIRKHEIDIFDIPIALITEEYLKYIDRLEELDLQVGGEWLETAAMLIYIKSRMLLPDDPGDDDEGPDPRDELVRRLIEYQRYKLFADKLDELPQLDREVFTHPPQAPRFAQMVGPPELREVGVGELLGALKRLVTEQKAKGNWVMEMTREELSLRAVMLEISSLLQDHPRIAFERLFTGHELSRYRVVTTFLALLEMTKLKIIKLFQSRLEDEETLYIERAVIDILEVSQSLDLPTTPE